MIPVFKRAKTVHALDRAAIVIGNFDSILYFFLYDCTCHWHQIVLYVSYATKVQLHQNHYHNDLLPRYYLYFITF
jgi:hypothetical protein